MKGLIVYRSYFGNTKHVAELIAEELTKHGHAVDTCSIAEAPRSLAEYEFIFVGAPTRFDILKGKGSANGRVRGWLKSVARKGFAAGRLLVVFDTCGQKPEDPAEAEKAKRYFEPGAARILAQVARQRGLTVYPKTLRCEVTGMKGPLKEGADVQARAFAREFAETLQA